MEFLTPLLVVAGFGTVLWMLSRRTGGAGSTEEVHALNQQLALLKANLEQKSQEAGRLEKQLELERRERDEQAGKSKTLFAQMKQLEAHGESLSRENQELRTRVTRFEAERERREEEQAQKLAKLEAAENALKQERERVIREDEEQKKQLEEARDRLWADHEHTVISSLTDLCKKPEFAFTAYSNTNLPEGFDGSLKPDFMVEFLGQYVIFDAKVSKAKSLQTYITKQVTDTVQKAIENGNDSIYKTIFLVVPTSALGELKNHHYVVEGYSVFVVCPEALPAILASLKRITLYEFAEQMDPQQRENIVQLIAELDFHINLRNAAEIVLSKMGTDLLHKAQRVDPSLSAEVAVKKQPMNAKAAIATAEIKKLVTRLEAQDEALNQMVSPRAPVAQQDLLEAKEVLIDIVKEEVVQQLL